MERTLTWEPGGLGSGTTLALARHDLREFTLPVLMHPENEEAEHGDGWDPFCSLNLELRAPDSLRRRMMGETHHSWARLPPRCTPPQLCVPRVTFRKARRRPFTVLRMHPILGPHMSDRQHTNRGRARLPLSFCTISPKTAFGSPWVPASYSHRGERAASSPSLFPTPHHYPRSAPVWF